ncbi:MAG: hypothetical protein K6A28_03680 [Bacteroidales bacterium]|nr:hypothetical protein [Bacteroidales bacterium]
MKTAKLFFGLLLCSMLFFACSKDDGEIVNPWGPTDATGFMACSVKGNVDYADFTVTLKPSNLTCDSLIVRKLEMKCWSKQDDADQIDTLKCSLIQHGVVFYKSNPDAKYEGVFEGLQPKKEYGYQLLVSDDFVMNDTLSGSFYTLDPTPTVKIDTAYLGGGKYSCEATVVAGNRSFFDEDYMSYIQMFWGDTVTGIDTPFNVDSFIPTELPGDSIQLHYVGSFGNTGSTSLWFRARVEDSWGDVVYSEPYRFNSDPISTITGSPDMTQWNSEGTVRLQGKASIGADPNVSLYRRGFCYGLSLNPTIQDNVVEADLAVWGMYSCTLNGLAPNTTYYYRSFLQLTNANGEVYYSSECQSFTTGDAPIPVSIAVGQHVQHPLLPADYYVLTATVDGEIAMIVDCGYVYKANAEGGVADITLEDNDGFVTGFCAAGAEVPQEFAPLLPWLGISLTEHDYITVLSGLTEGTTYSCRAFAKLSDGRVCYSNEGLTVQTP